jgi:hypothetical protein
MHGIKPSSSNSAEWTVSIPAPGGASTSEIVPQRSSVELAGPDGLRARRQSVGSSQIPRSPDSYTQLLSTRPSPNSPMSDHIMASRLGQMLGTSLGTIDRTSPDIESRLVENAGLLRARGFDTPEKVQALLKAAWRHDAGIAVAGMGLTGNAGYAIGMELASEKLVAMLPPHILRNPPMLGMVVGLGVGALDVAISVMGQATMKPLLYNGTDGNAHLPASVKVPSGAEAIMNSMKLATSANFLKNLPRVGAPAIQSFFEQRLQGVSNGSIQRLTADRVDVALDAGLGFAASAAVQFKNLTGATGYDARMLLRDDLGDVIDKMQRSTKDSLVDVAKSVGNAMMHPAVPLAVNATIGLFICELFAANSMIDSAGHSAAGSHGHLPPDRADWSVMTAKRASSVALMGLMTATIEIGAPIVGAAAQSATEAVVAGAGKAKHKIADATATAMNFISATAGHVPDIGGWVAHRLGLQRQAQATATAQAEAPPETTSQSHSQGTAA